MNPNSNRSQVRPAQSGLSHAPLALADTATNAGANRLSARSLIAGILSWLGRRACPARRLSILERLSLAPRQTLWLVEAEGTRLLIAGSAGGGFTFLELGSKTEPLAHGAGETGARVPLRTPNGIAASSATSGSRRW